MKKRVVFRADGNAEIGYGHFIRTLGIASLINNDFECVFATQEPTEYQISEINKVCGHLICLKKTDHLDVFLNHLRGDDIVVIDSYTFDFTFQLLIKDRGCKVIYIDDHNDKHYVCDALINNIPGFSKDSFDMQKYTKAYLGLDYALLRKEFFNPVLRKIRKNKNTVFLSFGGSDPLNISEKTIKFINLIFPLLKINLLIGDAYKYEDRLKNYNNVEVHKNIGALEVASLIAESEISIITASSLLNEVSCIGGKILVGYFAENQIQPYDYFVNNGLALGLGDLRNINLELLSLKLNEVINADFIIENQRKYYRYQQEDNLKRIFYDI
jgi:UDP-2,4-diacetamido-2,4,6-trideoxy-beta-L-altropyranose hydrolase